MKYELPNFKKFKPLKLNIELEKLKRKYDKLIYKEDNNTLLFLVQKVFNKQPLSNKEIGKILYNYSEVREIVDFKKMIKKKEFLENFKKSNLKIVEQNIKNVFDLLYQNIISNSKDDIQKEIKEIGNYFVNYGELNTKILNDFSKIILEFFATNISIIDFLEVKFFNYIQIEKDYGYFSILYRIDKETDIYKRVILLYFKKRLIEGLSIKNEEVDKKNIALFSESILNLEIKKEFYIVILKYYFEKNIDVDKYSKLWFQNIFLYMGNPENNEKWNNIETDYIDIFNNWLMYNELYKIFTLNVQDEGRLEFWKKYVNVIKKIEFFPVIDQAILMELENHTILEFGIKPNPSIIYEKKNMDNIIFKKLLKENSKSTMLWILKNRNYLKHMKHYKNIWQSRFKVELARLGYKEVLRNVSKNKRCFYE